MLIEDHKDIAEMVIAYLEGRGFDVDYSADGVTGLHLAVTNDYDVIVLDPDENSPAGKLATDHVCASYDDQFSLPIAGEKPVLF